MELARMTLPTRQAINERLARLQMKIFDAAEQVLDRMTAPQADTAPVSVARRQLANTLGLWRLCARSTCRRGRCCRGEPKHCLQFALPLLPAEIIQSLLPPRRTRRR
jgi:hypothetical protein